MVLMKSSPSRKPGALGLPNFVRNNFLLRSFIDIFIFPLDPLDILYFGPSCIFQMLVDPLFMYVLLINEDIKCVMLDHRLKRAALVLRSIGDVRYLVRIIVRIKKEWSASHSFYKIVITNAIDTVSLLPIPQVVILIFLPNMKGSNSLKIMKFLNSLILLQYLTRVHPIYIYCKTFNEQYPDSNKSMGWKWILILDNFLWYLLASHVLGAFWYFFSIQREIDCWGYASQIENESEFSTSCDENTFKNVTLLNNICPINQPNVTAFDFGIFQYALQSGMQGSTNLPQKVLQCFSWGLRNLSSFASNLNTSMYEWESLFVVLISITGLILFIYLLGHVQTLMLETKTSDRLQQKKKMIKKQRVESMLSDYGLPSDMTSDIKSLIEGQLEDDEDLDVENIFPLLSPTIQENFTRHLFLDKLKKVPKLKIMERQLLEEVCKHLERMIYSEGNYIIREGEPLDKMFFIRKGFTMTYMINIGGSTVSQTIQLEKKKDDLYGEELLSWAAVPSSKLSNLPISTITVKSLDEVEVFALKAPTLQDIVSNFSSYFNTHNTLPEIVVDGNSTEVTARHEA